MKEIISSIGKLNHIAIAVPSIQIASDMWKKALGANISAPQILTDHGVKVIFVGNKKHIGESLTWFVRNVEHL